MSRVGSSPVKVPASVKVEIVGHEVRATGPKGTLSATVDSGISIEMREDHLVLSPVAGSTGDLDRRSAAMWGLGRSLVQNVVTGVSEGFKKILEIRGVGYRGAMVGNKLQLSLGFSHPVVFLPPEGVSLVCSTPTRIEVSGIDKQAVGQVAANIRRFRRPEPYKGKGIRYEGEYVRIKEGKKK